jgi:hypothetical protein
MDLYELATTTDATGKQLVSCRIAIADHADPAARKEWLDAQIAIDLPTVLNGALLRAAALRKVRDELHRLAIHFENIGRDPQSAPPNPNLS